MPYPVPCQQIAASIEVAQDELRELLHPEPGTPKPTQKQIDDQRKTITKLEQQLADCLRANRPKTQGYGIVVEISQDDITRTISDLIDPSGAGEISQTQTIYRKDGARDPATGNPTDGTRLRAEVHLDLKRAWFMNRAFASRPDWPDPGWTNSHPTDPGWINLDLTCHGRIVLEALCRVTTDSNGVQENHFYPPPDPPPDLPLDLGLTVSTKLVTGDIRVIDHPCSDPCTRIATSVAEAEDELRELLHPEPGTPKPTHQQIDDQRRTIAKLEEQFAGCRDANPGPFSAPPDIPPDSKYRYQDLYVNFADSLKISCDWGPVGPCEVLGNEPLPEGKCEILRSSLFGLDVVAEMLEKNISHDDAVRSVAADLLPELEEQLTSSISDYLSKMGDSKNGVVLFQRFTVDGPESDSAIPKLEYHVDTPDNTESMLICIKAQQSTGAENPRIEQYDSDIVPNYIDAAVVIDGALLLGRVMRDQLARTLNTDSGAFELGDDDVLRLTRTTQIKGGGLAYDLTKLDAQIVGAKTENGVHKDGEIKFSGSIHKETDLYTISSDFGFSLSFSPIFIFDESKVSSDLRCCSFQSIAVGIEAHLSDATTSNSSLNITPLGYIAIAAATAFLFGIPAALFITGATAVADYMVDMWGEGGVVGTALRSQLGTELSGMAPQSSLGLSGYHFMSFDLRDYGLAVTLRKLPRELCVGCYMPDNQDADRRIQGLGGLLAGTSIVWRLSLDEAIASVRRMDEIQAAMSAGTVPSSSGVVPRTFYIEAPSGEKTQLMAKAIRKPSGVEVWYLTTKGDDKVSNNLLALPHCSLAVDPVAWWSS
jgi:hypothetical protein